MSIDSGGSSPSVLAVLRLIRNSTLVGCSTGRSAGLVPLSTRSEQFGGDCGRRAVPCPLQSGARTENGSAETIEAEARNVVRGRALSRMQREDFADHGSEPEAATGPGRGDDAVCPARREIKRKTIAERRVGYLPASSGVIRRTVTRRFCSLGPCTGTLSCCSP